MPTSKKTSKKKAAKKGTKKAATSRVNLAFPVDPEKAEAIKRCLAKGSLRVTVGKAELSRARLSDPYLWD